MPDFIKIRNILFFLSLFIVPSIVSAQPLSLRIGMAAVFLDEPGAVLTDWAAYLSRQLGHPVDFIQRRTYAELTQGLQKGELQAGWICTYPYLNNRTSLRLLAVPVFAGQPVYNSYLIVPVTDTATRDISDLQGKVFAYAENQSFSGYIIPRFWLKQAHIDADHFFRQSFFTWSHRDSVVAVADGLADGAAVDGYIWEVMQKTSPQITAKTRVVKRSRGYGFPPMVAAPSMQPDDFKSLQKVLVSMQDTAEGRSLLTRLHLDRFAAPDPKIYRSALKLVENNGSR